MENSLFTTDADCRMNKNKMPSPHTTLPPHKTVREVKVVPSKWLYSKKHGPEGRAGNQEILALKATLAWFFD